MKKIISFALALLAALSTASFAVFADGEELKSPNPVPGRANPTGNILEFDDLTGAGSQGRVRIPESTPIFSKLTRSMKMTVGPWYSMPW